MANIADSQQADSGDVVRGMAIMVTAMLVLPMLDAIGKYLTTECDMSPGQVTFYRFLFQLITTMPMVVIVGGVAALKPKRLWINLLRGAILGAASFFFFAAVSFMPLADAIAIFFVEPFILTAASAIIFRERVGWRRWLAIAVGLSGALIVINPSFADFGPVALFPLATASLFVCYLLLNRVAGVVDSPLIMQYAAGIGGTLLAGAFLVGGSAAGVGIFEASLPSSALAWLLVLVLGVLAGYGHLLVVRAFRLAPGSLLAPFQYVEIISATILGFIVFGDFPSLSKWLGIAIIIGSGLFIFARERKLALAASRATARPVVPGSPRL